MTLTRTVEKWQVTILEASEYDQMAVALVAFKEFPAFAYWLERAPFEITPHTLGYLCGKFYYANKG